MVEKITIENLRREALGAIVDERKSIIISRKRKLQELYAVCRYVERSKEFPNGDIVATWGTVEDYGGANMEDAEKRFLEENDMDRGRLFSESTLPQRFPCPPEPGGLAQQTSAPAPKQPSKSPTPATPLKAFARALTSTLAIDETSPTSTDIKTQDPELPVEKRLRHNSYVEPVPLDRTVKPLLSNGNKIEVDHGSLINGHPVLDLKIESSSEQARSLTQKPILVVEGAKLDTPAPMIDVGGVPAIQDTITRIPDERKKSMGDHPPVPAELTEQENQDVPMEDRVPASEPATPIVSPTKTATPSPEAELEALDSQEVPHSPVSPPVTDRIFPHPEEAHLPSQQQIPSHAPLVVVTTQKNQPSPTPFASPARAPTLQPEASSPTSSIDDVETPNGAILSSATSPDASHMVLEHPRDGKDEMKEVISEVDGVDIVVNGQVQQGEDVDAITGKDPESRENKPSMEPPSVSVAEGETVSPTIQLEVLASPRHERSPSSVPRDQTPITLAKPSEASIAEHSLPVGQLVLNSSPDPSAQLRLEHQLANGAPVPPTSIVAINSATSTPSQAKEREPEAVVMHHHEEEEEEDEVQLVGSREPEPAIRPRTPVKTPVEIPIQTPTEPKTEIARFAKQAVEEVLQTETEEVSIHAPSPGPAEVAHADFGRVDSQPGSAASESVEDRKQTGEEEDEEEEDEEGVEEEGVEEEVEEEEEEEEKEDVVMHDEPEGISVPYQSSPALLVDTDADVDAEGEDDVDEAVAEAVERSHEEHGRMDISEENVPDKSPNPTMQPIPSPINEKDDVPESIAEQAIVPPVDSSLIADEVAVKAVNTVADTEPVTAVNFNLPTPDATNAQSSAPASTASISPFRQKSSKALGKQKEREKSRSKLRKVVISSAHHAAAAAEAEAQRLREDQEKQGMIVVARRREQAASAAARGRGAPFPTGSRTEVITRYGIVDTPPADINLDKKNVEIFDVLYTVKSSQHSAKDLISRASKTVSTSNHQVHFFESQAARILATIQKMQDEGLHSLRQIERAREPKRRKCHWDYLIEEAKWLREDFREERRWKIAVAKQVVDWVVEWHETGDRRELCVDRRRWGRVPKWIREERLKTAQGGDSDMVGASGFEEVFRPSTPELVVGGTTPEDEGSEDYFEGRDEHGVVGWGVGRDFFGYLQDPPPAAIFTLGPEETVFGVAPTKAAEDMLGQLPLFAPPKPPDLASRRFEYVEEEWMTPIIPVTKHCTGKLALEQEQEGPPRKKSRYEYEENYELFADDSDEDDAISGGSYIGQHGKRERDRTRKPVPLPPEQTNVALFSPNSKNLLQRIHNAHLFRPPSDFPPTAFFESRTPSLWTAIEDETLKQLAREYHHNWSLIATCMALEGTWHSGSERRSPWECFERWIGLEPVNPDFMKSPYYKQVQNRLDIAAKVGGMYVSANPNSAGGSNQQGPMTKRRGTVPMKVEKRRVTKYFNILDAMRKLAKKRETSISKQQSGRAAQTAPARKAPDLPNNPSQKTPAFFSQMKFERELKHLEQKAMYLQTMQARGQPIAGMPQAGRLHPAQQQAIANGVPIPGTRIQTAGMPNGIQQVARSPSVPHAIPNGVVPGMNSLPVIQRHSQAQMQGRPTPEQIQQLRMMQQVKAAQLQGQQGYSQQPASVAQMQVAVSNFQTSSQQATKAILLQQAQQAQQAALGQKMSSIPNGQAGSPRMQQQPFNVQQGGSVRGQGLQLTAAEMIVLVQQQHPNLPQDQIVKATAQHIAIYHQQISQNMARNQNPNGQATSSSPVQQTATSQQLLQRVQQQQAQHAQAQAQAQSRATAANTGPMMSVNGPVGPGANAVSRSATPQQQRSGSAQSPRSLQQSPRLGQAMLVGQQQGQQGQGQ